jgi:hypothetical protein
MYFRELVRALCTKILTLLHPSGGDDLLFIKPVSLLHYISSLLKKEQGLRKSQIFFVLALVDGRN